MSIKKLLAAAGLGVIVFAVALGAYIHFNNFVNEQLDLPAEGIRYEVRPGSSFGAVAADLEKLEVIENARMFKLLARLKGVEASIKVGEFIFAPPLTHKKVLQNLVSGKVVRYKLTIPEGYNINQIAEAAEAAGLCSREEFSRLAGDAELAHSLGIEGDSLEGYLFPDTYYFSRDQSAKSVVRQMVENFRANFGDDLRARAKKFGFTVHQAVTLASIIEKETGAPQERRTISSVFHRRLESGMKLQTDPTVIYGIANFNGNLTRKNLETPTPYNTYTNYGLPPGPIANPGRAALEAALDPADTKYLYFVARGDGEHHFSSTIAEHNRMVRKYQIELPRQRRAEKRRAAKK